MPRTRQQTATMEAEVASLLLLGRQLETHNQLVQAKLTDSLGEKAYSTLTTELVSLKSQVETKLHK